MAKKNKRQDWMLDFLDWRLTADEKKEFEAFYAKSGEELLGRLSDLLGQEYKVTLSWDEQNDTMITTFTPKSDTDPNHGWAMSSRHKNAYTSLALGLYKHFYLCSDCEWPTDASFSDNWG